MPISSKLFSDAPNKPAVYCLIERKDVIYVGISKSLGIGLDSTLSGKIVA